MGQLERVKAIDFRYWQGQTITVEEVQFLFDCLETDNVTLIAPAAVCLSHMDDDVLLELAKRFLNYSSITQHVLIPLMCTTDRQVCYQPLFRLLKTLDDGPTVDLIVMSLSKTEYPLMQFIIQAFSDYDPVLTDRIKTMLRKAGFHRYKAMLAMFPNIPFEREFREVFGGDRIDQIKAR